MTDESKQLSVAELLARNGQGGSGSGGGGRRRRGGRGISVAELSGDMPVVGGRGSHAAPDPEPEAPEPAAYQAPYEPASYEPPAYDPAPYAPAAYEPPQFDPVAPEPVSYTPPVPEPEMPSYSPMSGPITRYDPLANFGDPATAYQPPTAEYQSPDYQQDYQSPVPDYPAPGRSNLVMPGREMPPATPSRHSAPADSPDPYGQAPGPYGQAPDSYGQAPGPYGQAPDSYGQAPDSYGQAPGAYGQAPDPYGQAPGAYGQAPDSYGQAPGAYGQAPDLYGQTQDPYAPAPDAYGKPQDPYAYVPPDAPAADSAPPLGSGRTGRRRRHAEPDDDTTDVGPPLHDLGHHDPEPPRPEPPLPRNGRAARRRAQAEEVDTGAWSPHDEEVDTGGWSPHDEDSAPLPLTPLPAPPEQRRATRRDSGLPAWSARRRKPNADDAPESGGISTAAWSLASQDQQLVSGSTVAGDLLRDGVERAERRDAERENGSRGRRGRSKRKEREIDPDDGYTDVHDSFDDDEDDDEEHSGGFAARLAAGRARFTRRLGADRDTEDDDEHTGGLATRLAGRGSRTARRSEHEANRRQWVILGSQSTGAAVAGMLLFKGFERMWEMLPWVALALAMIVILGLVALVRILRRTDDILSTVIAVVVGIFVTLGPLAFLLSTN
ncbi:hypothetical protein [Nocardia sp. NPDC051832]|uniref:hypothetical protein n=1 Tax=Nocardia sp. NPDC051832 TaxID=3155673 RepID=UPI003445F332